MIGHNTDAPAFAQTLQPLLHPWHSQALILGTGGASKAVAYALQQLGISFTFVSRTPEKHPHAISYAAALDCCSQTYLIVNCTPAGMFPDVDQSPWPNTPPLTERHLCYDLIYNPTKTRFLQQAKGCGASIVNGLAMLERQAQLSWQIWLDSQQDK
jgi:shikimate dehydrogenase